MAESAREQVAALAAVLESGALKLATAESCTGGWIAKVLTDRAGSSAWFEYGVVTYGNNAKQKLLGVTAEMLEERGAVSEAVACRMAEGALALSGADIALAVTGIAGPDGGSPDKPVGTVWFAWARATSTDSECCVFEGDRTAVRWQTVQHALAGVLSRLE